LAKALIGTTTLQTIILSSNYIGDLGAEALAQFLSVNRSVTSLQLGNNNIGDEGGQKICQAVLNNQNRKWIVFAHEVWNNSALLENIF
jgi:Ran GTPase-activating protein (RanGAP) involved in mRNA processing and transport